MEHYQLTPPKPVPGGRMAQAKHAFAKPLRQEYLNAGERVRLSRSGFQPSAPRRATKRRHARAVPRVDGSNLSNRRSVQATTERHD